MLTTADQKVYLPDALAGCSMADMANLEQLEQAWQVLETTYTEPVIPVTYINSTAAVKAFVGNHDGVIVTSSNAETILKRVFDKHQRVLFLPDQHLGRNTAYQLGIPLEQMAVWHPKQNRLEAEGVTFKISKLFSGKGAVVCINNIPLNKLQPYAVKFQT